MKLTHKACENLKPLASSYKKADGGGMYLLVLPTGGKSWRMKYRLHGKEHRITFGQFPHVSLAEARERRDRAKSLLAQGIDPNLDKKQQAQSAASDAEQTFRKVALAWHAQQSVIWSKVHTGGVLHRLETDIFPHIGDLAIKTIAAREVRTLLLKIQERGAPEMAKRARQVIGQVFRYGVGLGLCERDWSYDLKDILQPAKVKHFAAIEPVELPAFVRDLAANKARLYARTVRAMKLLMLTFVRTSELIEAHWSEFDFDAGEWRIPAERMKMRKAHIVPLSVQAIAILREQLTETGQINSPYVFPSQINPRQPMSNCTILGALRRLGYGGRMTGHGFRALAMTAIIEQLGFPFDVVDRQLAHGHRNKVRAAYDRAQHLPERKRMMQAWADHCYPDK